MFNKFFPFMKHIKEKRRKDSRSKTESDNYMTGTKIIVRGVLMSKKLEAATSYSGSSLIEASKCNIFNPLPTTHCF